MSECKIGFTSGSASSSSRFFSCSKGKQHSHFQHIRTNTKFYEILLVSLYIYKKKITSFSLINYALFPSIQTHTHAHINLCSFWEKEKIVHGVQRWVFYFKSSNLSWSRNCDVLTPTQWWTELLSTACMSLDLLSQVIYLLLDVMYSFPNKEGASVESFPTAFAIPIGLVKLVQGLWLLDHHDHQVCTHFTDFIFA